MALRGKPSTEKYMGKNNHVTKHTSRKSKASRSLVERFVDEIDPQSSGRRISSRLREKQEDALSESLLCEVDDDDSRVISELEQSTDVSCLGDHSDSNKDSKNQKNQDICHEFTKTDKSGHSEMSGLCEDLGKQHNNTTRCVSSDSASSDGTASLSSFECRVSNNSKIVANRQKTRASCRVSYRSLNTTKENCNPVDISVATAGSRISSASHNATRGSFGSPQLVEESPDVQMSGLAAEGNHLSCRRAVELVPETVEVGIKPGNLPEPMSTLVHHSTVFQTPVSHKVTHTVNNLLESVTPRAGKKLGISGCDITQGRELFKKMLEVARAASSRSAQKAASSVHKTSPAIDGITSLTKATPTPEHRRIIESCRVTPISQSGANVSPFAAEARISNRTVTVTPKTPKSVHFRDFSRSPSVGKMSLHKRLCSPSIVLSGNNFKTPEQQRFLSANEMYTTPVNQMVSPSGGVVPLLNMESPIPDTQPISSVLLKDVVAYVEVRSNGEDRSAGVKSHLQELGATVVDRLNKRVTHILFKEGLMSTYNKAMKWRIPLVTLQWIEECKKRECVVSERLFLPSNLDVYQSPDPLKKIKRVKYFHTGEEDDRKSRRVKQKKLEKLKVTQVETDASTETDTDSLLGNIREQNGNKDMSYESRLLHTLQRLVDSGEGSCQQDEDSSNLTSDDEMCVPLAVRLLRQLQNSDHKRPRSKNNDENVDFRHVEHDRNMSNKFVISENRKGDENRSPLHTNSKSRKKLCLSSEKCSVLKHNEKESTVSDHEQSSYNLVPVETAPSKKFHNETAHTLSGKNNFTNSIASSTLNSSLVSNSSKGRGRKRKLMPLSQSSSPTIADTTLISQDSPPCFTGTSKKMRTCSPVSEEMELTQCVPANSGYHDNEAGCTAGPTSVTCSQQLRTPTASTSKRNRKRLTRASIAVPSPSQSPQLVLTRRSSGVFIKVKAKQERMSKTFPSLVLTSFPREDVEMIAACVMKLSGFQLEAKVSRWTTHVVSNGPRRTLNMLKGIARGCWILTQEWVLNSLEAGKWLPEESFEIKNFSPAVTCRVERECLGPGFRLDLFKSCGPMLIGKQSKPPAEDLKELIRLCGGQLVNSVKDADIAIGLKVRNERITCLAEKWILDSVTQLSIQPTNEYILDRRLSHFVG